MSEEAMVVSLPQFLELHESQFAAMRLPASLRKVVHKKLHTPRYLPEENLFQLRDSETKAFKYIVAKSSIRKYSDAWLVPHILTGTAMEVYTQILEEPELCERLWKMMNLDVTVKLSEEDQMILFGKVGADLTSADIPAGATPALPAVEADKDMIETVMEFGEVNRENAIKALVKSRNDLISAIAECQTHEEFISREAHMNSQFFGSYQKAEAAEQSSEEQRKVKKAQVVFGALFELSFIGVFYTMIPRTEDSPYKDMPPQPEEIKTNYFVMHECGQQIAASDAPNCKVGTLVALTLNNTSWTVVFPEMNISMGKPVTRPMPPKVAFPNKN